LVINEAFSCSVQHKYKHDYRPSSRKFQNKI